MKATYIEHMGNDLRVVNAARVSFKKESEWSDDTEDGVHGVDLAGAYLIPGLTPKDKKLIKYLADHGHWTPFSHPQITMHETVPIFVARQRFKHMVGFTYNEVSRRYVDDDPEFYHPDEWRRRAENKKQGSSDDVVEFLGLRGFQRATPSKTYEHLLTHAESVYHEMIEYGVAPEQARMVLPQSMYTEYYVTGSLAAWARAYKQRIDEHAQKEIRDLAQQWGQIIEPLFPVSWKALT